MKSKKAPKGSITTLPSTLAEIKTARLENLTSAAQRKLLVSLNRESNKRLQSIAKLLNKDKLRPGILQENKEFFRIKQKGKGWNFYTYYDPNGTRKSSRFTLKKNATKTEMEIMIRERVQFLESRMTVTADTERRSNFLPEVKKDKAKNIKEVYSAQKKGLLDLYNDTFGKDNKRLSNAQFDKFISILERARSGGLIRQGATDYKYLKDLESVAKIREKKDMTINQLLDELEIAVEAETTKMNNKTKADNEAMRQAAMGGAIPV